MDRSLKVYSKSGHLFAEFEFSYNYNNQATTHYTQYRRLYDEDEEDENKSVYPLFDTDRYLQFRKFDTLDQIKQHDRQVVKNELGRDMKDEEYTYDYGNDPILLRYVSENHRGCTGIVDIRFNFNDNLKQLKFYSAQNPRFDVDLESNSLETNMEAMARIPIYRDREEPGQLSLYDLKRLPAWY